MLESVPELKPSTMDHRVAVLNSSTKVLPDTVPAHKSSPQPGTSTATVPDLSLVIVPLSPLSSEVEVLAPSDVAAETSAPASKVEVGTSQVAFDAPALVSKSQETPVQTEAVSLTTSAT